MKILALTLEKCSECAIFVDDKIIFASSEKEIDIKETQHIEKDLKPLDFITVSCYDWSEESGYQDEMRITVTSEKYELWLEKLNKKQN